MVGSRPAPDQSLFTTRIADLPNGVRLAYVRSGEGGYPLLLLHGYPETKRIWWRNIGPLAEVGFDVLAPDLRGYGESGFAPDGHYDPAAYSIDVHALLSRELGIDRCVAVGGDIGGAVAIDLALRFPGFVERLCVFNTEPPSLPEAYKLAGIPPDMNSGHSPVADYARRQGTDAEALLAELDTTEKRRRYIGDFYGHRLWGAPDAFRREEVDFMTEPFGDAGHLRASWVCYEVVYGIKSPLEKPRLSEAVHLPTLALYGPEDHVISQAFADKCAVAFPNCIGPFPVPGAGHFLQWERASLLNRSLTWFLADLRARPPG